MVGKLAGSTGSTTDGESEPGPTPRSPAELSLPTDPPSVDVSQSDKIPLNGTKAVPIHWRLPEGTSSFPDAVTVARQWTALDLYVKSQKHYKRLAPLYGSVTAGEKLKEIYDSTRRGMRGARQIGPVWIQVYPPHAIAAQGVEVTLCAGRGWYHEVGQRVKSLSDRARWSNATTYRVQRLEDGTWKVVAVGLADAAPASALDDAEPLNLDASDPQASAWPRTRGTTRTHQPDAPASRTAHASARRCRAGRRFAASAPPYGQPSRARLR